MKLDNDHQSDVLLGLQVVLQHEKLIESGPYQHDHLDSRQDGQVLADILNNGKCLVLLSLVGIVFLSVQLNCFDDMGRSNIAICKI